MIAGQKEAIAAREHLLGALDDKLYALVKELISTMNASTFDAGKYWTIHVEMIALWCTICLVDPTTENLTELYRLEAMLVHSAVGDA